MDCQTRQRMLELVYELLPETEAAELRRQIDADEELARAYAEAQHTAKLLAEAAKLPAPKVELEPPERPLTTPSGRSVPQAAIRSESALRAPRARRIGWAVLAATVLLLLLPSVGSYWWHKEGLDRIAGGHLRLMVTGPAVFPAGVGATYTVKTTTITGAPLPAEVELALYSPDGRRLHGHNGKAGADGRLQVTIPADVDVPSGAKLKVLAIHGKNREPVEMRLAVEPVHFVTHLSLDKPLYRPGETVYYRSLSLSRFGLAADRQMPIHFEILDPSGAVVPGSQLQGVTERGVGSGAFVIPQESPGGEYVLVARSLDQAFPDERRPFFIRRYRLGQLKKELEFTRDSYAPGDTVVADFLVRRGDGAAAAGAKLRIIATVDGTPVFRRDTQADGSGAFQVKFDLPEKIERGDGQLVVVADDGGSSETIAKTIPINLGKVDVTFYPEGGDLVAGLENRVYFVGRDPLGEPVHLEGTIVDDSGSKIALVETTHEGMGAFRLKPDAQRQYRLKITSPAGVGSQPRLPEVSTRQNIVLSTGTGVFGAGEPLEFNVRSAKAGVPLVVAASCRGVPVGQQALVTTRGKDNGNRANPVAIQVPEEVGGVIRLTVYNYSGERPQPVAERLVYRRSRQQLRVRAAGYSQRYSPGDRVKMSLTVTNEKDEPVPAVLGVAVVDDDLLSLAAADLHSHTPAMTTHFLLTTEVEKPEDLEDADFYLSDDPKAEAALDLLLGTQGWRRFVEKSLSELGEEGRTVHKDTVLEDNDQQLLRLAALGGSSNPPAVFDNLGQIQSSYQEGLAAYQAQWNQGMDVLTTLSFMGGLGLLLLVVMLGLLKVVSGIHFWGPAAGVTICCLVIGVVLVDPARLRSGPETAVAFAPFHVEPPEVEEGLKTEDEVLAKWRFRGMEKSGQDDLADEFGREKERILVRNEALPFALPADKLLPMKEAHAELLGDKLDLAKDFINRNPAMKFQADLEADRKMEIDGDLARAGDWLHLRGELAKNLEKYRFTVRQYAHKHVAGPPGVRTDFTETVFWHPMLVADAEGRAEIAFDLSDSTGIFRLRVDAHGQGRIGSGGAEVISKIPFSLEPKLPLEVAAGDRIDLPLAVINDSKSELPVELLIEHGDLVTIDGKAKRQLELQPSQRSREYFTLEVTGQKGDCELTFRGTAGDLADAVKRPLKVVPPGFPKSSSHSGEIDGSEEVVVDLPEYWVPGSLEVTLNAFPSMLADLQQGMESILREPTGCFEQASTSNYPNVLTMQYMQEHDVANPAVTRRAKDLLKKGYAKLTGYECSQKGYEWFGGDPGHEALTAYGLMEFRDMAEVYHVDREMIDRTARWLMDRRDGKGGFKRNAKALDSFGRAPQQITDAYVVWALSESGQQGIETEIKHVAQLAADSDDPYLIALAAAALGTAEKDTDEKDTDEKDQGKKLLDKLARAQAEDGHLEGKQGSITRSGGQSLKVETTALAALAWLKLPAFAEQANRAVKWIVKNRQGSGGFGSTQATILALKALVAHSKANRKTLAAGTLIVKRDDLQIGRHDFGAGQQETIVIDGLEANLQPGENRLTVNLTGENKMPYALDVGFRTRKPSSHEGCPLRLTAKLAEDQVKAGETVAMTAKLTNISHQGQPMTIAILGLPAGLEARGDQLEELKKAGTIDYYETRAREVICYWRSLAPKQEVTVKLDLVAAVPGKYTGPASRTYLYYTSEQKQWAAPLQVEIARD